MNDKIEALKARHKQLQEQMAAEGRQLLKELFTDFFAAHTEILTVYWDQYTPHFNDGDPCVFRCHADDGGVTMTGEYAKQLGVAFEPVDDQDDHPEVEAKLKTIMKTTGVARHKALATLRALGEVALPSVVKISNVRYEKPTPESVRLFVTSLSDIPKEIYLSVFGDHALVTAKRTGEFEVTAYDHD